MDARTAVATARNYFLDMFSDENVQNVGLEEIEFDEGFWQITFGFSRPWDIASNKLTPLPSRSYKIVKLKDHGQLGEIVSIKNRDVPE